MMVAKAEKIKQMAYDVSLSALKMDNQQPRLQNKVQRLSFVRGVHASAWKRLGLNR